MADRTRLLSALARHRWVLEPALALALFAAWLVAGLPFLFWPALAMVFYAASVALARVLQGATLTLIWFGLLADLTEGDPLPTAFRLISAVAVVTALFSIASHGGRALRWLGFVSALLWSPVVAYLFTVRGEVKFPRFGPLIAGYYTSQGVGVVLMSLLLAVVFVSGWLLGFLVSRERVAERDSRSMLMWLAASGGTPPTTDGPQSERLVRRLSRRQLTLDIGGAIAFVPFCLLLDLSSAYLRQEGGRSTVVIVIVFAVAVALWRMAPAVALAIAWLGAVFQLTTGHNILVCDIAVLMVLYATAAYGDQVVRYAGLISAGLGAFVAGLYLSLSAALSQGYFDLLSAQFTGLALQFAFLFVVSVTVLGLSWVLGVLMRTWRNARYSRSAQMVAEIERNRAEQDVAIEQERTRIARDMHDVVAHSLAVVIAQADGARYARRTAPEAVDEALTTIAATARSALADVRVLLAELRQSQPEGPQPTLASLDQTVEQIRAAGLAVAVERLGEFDRLGSAQQIAAYRIVQEALTNALRHGDTTKPATVVLAETARIGGGSGLVITVRNSMKSVPAETASTGSLPRIGHGLPGMRERASLAGGTLSAAAAEGVFVVSAFLPALVATPGAEA